jgi:hypothetical protein
VVTAEGGAAVALHGFNYFGFNNGQTAPDGLWVAGPSAAADLSTIIYQMRLLGFNLVSRAGAEARAGARAWAWWHPPQLLLPDNVHHAAGPSIRA